MAATVAVDRRVMHGVALVAPDLHPLDYQEVPVLFAMGMALVDQDDLVDAQIGCRRTG